MFVRWMGLLKESTGYLMIKDIFFSTCFLRRITSRFGVLIAKTVSIATRYQYIF